jgi:hypothetical protein
VNEGKREYKRKDFKNDILRPPQPLQTWW